MFSPTQRNSTLQLAVSRDGVEFTPATFPSALPSLGYTILQSSTGFIYLDVYMSSTPNQEYGKLYMSDAAGTHFKESRYTNRDSRGFVDFEKVAGIPGFAFLNTVVNPGTGLDKHVQTLVTRNDGNDWMPLEVGGSGLHMHLYTHQHDRSDTLSVAAAPGLWIGVANTGDRLLPYNSGDVYSSSDAGHTFKLLQNEAHMIQVGAQGSMVLLVPNEEPTTLVKYSLDFVTFKPFR